MLEAQGTGRQTFLESEAGPLVAALDGSRTLKALVLELVGGRHALSLGDLFAILQVLERDGLLAAPLGLAPADDVEERRRQLPVALRPFFEAVFLTDAKFPAFLPAAVLLALGALGASAFYAYDVYLDYTPAGFLRGPGGYQAAPAIFAVFASLLAVARGLAGALITAFATGRLRRLRLGVHWFGLSLASDDDALTTVPRRWAAALCALAPAFFLPAVGALLTLAMGFDSALAPSVQTLSIYMALLALHPSARGAAALALDAFVPRERQRHMAAYLRHRSVLSVATSRGRAVEGETGMVLYSSAALLWAVGGLLFSLVALRENLPALQAAWLSSPDSVQRFGVAFTAAVLAGGALLFASDLSMTLLRNVVFPLVTPFLKVSRSIGTKTVKAPDRAEIERSLGGMGFFGGLSDDARRMVASKGVVKEYRAGTRLIIQGDQGRELFALLDGEVEVRRREATGIDTAICVLRRGSVFGEMALIKDIPRTADVAAKTPIRAFVLGKDMVDALLKEGNREDHQRILDQIALGHYLSSANLFRGLPAESSALLREAGRLRRVAAGEAVVKEGEAPDSFYLVIRGWARVLKRGQEIGLLKQGDFFGEMGLLDDAPRAATIEAAEEMLVLEVGRDTFWQVVAESPRLALALDAAADLRRGA